MLFDKYIQYNNYVAQCDTTRKLCFNTPLRFTQNELIEISQIPNHNIPI